MDKIGKPTGTKISLVIARGWEEELLNMKFPSGLMKLF